MLDVAQLGNSSVIKFGGYDVPEFADKFLILNTTFDGQWMISLVGFNFNYIGIHKNGLNDAFPERNPGF